MSHKPTLRYFDCRGRAQFLRHYLTARGIEFVDERVALSPGFSEWLAMRDNRGVTGPFQRLPVLEFDGDLIPEALVIARFLHRQCGDAQAMSEQRNRQHEILLSSVYCDLMLPLGMLLWSDIVYPGCDLAAVARQALERITRYVTMLDATLAEWGWAEALTDREPFLADCLLWEELSAAQRVFGRHLDLTALPALTRVWESCPSRDAFERLLAEHPGPIPARPAEPEAIARLHGHLAAG